MRTMSGPAVAQNEKYASEQSAYYVGVVRAESGACNDDSDDARVP